MMRRGVLRRIGLIAAYCAALAACSGSATEDSSTEESALMTDARELILVAAPRHGDPYYADVADDIFAFHIAYAKAVEGRDDFIVLTDRRSYSRYADALGEARVAIAPQADIWTRDFSPSYAQAPVMFRYTAEGQGSGRRGQQDADHVQEQFASLLETAGARFTESDLFNDGGNLVDDYSGRVVLSRKFLRDNGFDEETGRKAVIEATGASSVAFIESDEQGGLEHADGVVAFVDEGVLIINSYPDDPKYAAELRADLERGLPGVTIHEIVTPYDGSEIYDQRFGSACGLYTNMLVTPHRVYLPQFGIAQDEEALASVRSWTDKEVVPVRSDKVCHMGGGVRCMSAQLRGLNALRLLEWAHQ